MKNFKWFITEGQIEKSKATVEDIIKKMSNKTFIVFDTETTGLDPKKTFTMITELAAMAIDSETGKEIDKYHKKATLSTDVYDRIKEEEEILANILRAEPWDKLKAYSRNDAVKFNNKIWIARASSRGTEPKKTKNKSEWKEHDPKNKTIKDLLSMTFYEEETTDFIDIKELLLGFKSFVEKQKNPLLIAHNAKFDLYQVNGALGRIDNKLRINVETLDTLSLMKKYLVPMIELRSKNGDKQSDDFISILKDGGDKIRHNLSVLGQIFKVQNKSWHSGLADTQQLAEIVVKMKEYFKSNL